MVVATIASISMAIFNYLAPFHIAVAIIMSYIITVTGVFLDQNQGMNLTQHNVGLLHYSKKNI